VKEHCHFEDFAVGDVFHLGTVTATEEELVEFARRYDPQPFHVDAELARATPFGGLVASGWQTLALVTRPLVDRLLTRTAACGSPGVEKIRWPTPLRPGDVLKIRATVVAARRSVKHAARGTLKVHLEAVNQRGQLAASFLFYQLVECRS
jgi:acyl dehydratase